MAQTLYQITGEKCKRKRPFWEFKVAKVMRTSKKHKSHTRILHKSHHSEQGTYCDRLAPQCDISYSLLRQHSSYLCVLPYSHEMRISVFYKHELILKHINEQQKQSRSHSESHNA